MKVHSSTSTAGKKSLHSVSPKMFESDMLKTNKKIQTLTIKDCKGPQTNMPKNVGSIKT